MGFGVGRFAGDQRSQRLLGLVIRAVVEEELAPFAQCRLIVGRFGTRQIEGSSRLIDAALSHGRSTLEQQTLGAHGRILDHLVGELFRFGQPLLKDQRLEQSAPAGAISRHLADYLAPLLLGPGQVTHLRQDDCQVVPRLETRQASIHTRQVPFFRYCQSPQVRVTGFGQPPKSVEHNPLAKLQLFITRVMPAPLEHRPQAPARSAPVSSRRPPVARKPSARANRRGLTG